MYERYHVDDEWDMLSVLKLNVNGGCLLPTPSVSYIYQTCFGKYVRRIWNVCENNIYTCCI